MQFSLHSFGVSSHQWGLGTDGTQGTYVSPPTVYTREFKNREVAQPLKTMYNYWSHKKSLFEHTHIFMDAITPPDGWSGALQSALC